MYQKGRYEATGKKINYPMLGGWFGMKRFLQSLRSVRVCLLTTVLNHSALGCIGLAIGLLEIGPSEGRGMRCNLSLQVVILWYFETF